MLLSMHQAEVSTRANNPHYSAATWRSDNKASSQVYTQTPSERDTEQLSDTGGRLTVVFAASSIIRVELTLCCISGEFPVLELSLL